MFPELACLSMQFNLFAETQYHNAANCHWKFEKPFLSSHNGWYAFERININLYFTFLYFTL